LDRPGKVNKLRIEMFNKAWKDHEDEQLGRVEIATILGRIRKIKYGGLLSKQQIVGKEQLLYIDEMEECDDIDDLCEFSED